MFAKTKEHKKMSIHLKLWGIVRHVAHFKLNWPNIHLQTQVRVCTYPYNTYTGTFNSTICICACESHQFSQLVYFSAHISAIYTHGQLAVPLAYIRKKMVEKILKRPVDDFYDSLISIYAVFSLFKSSPSLYPPQVTHYIRKAR